MGLLFCVTVAVTACEGILWLRLSFVRLKWLMSLCSPVLLYFFSNRVNLTRKLRPELQGDFHNCQVSQKHLRSLEENYLNYLVSIGI